MKNTDEARKVRKKNGPMYWAVYERVQPKINSIEMLLNILKVDAEENNNDNLEN